MEASGKCGVPAVMIFSLRTIPRTGIRAKRLSEPTTKRSKMSRRHMDGTPRQLLPQRYPE